MNGNTLYRERLLYYLDKDEDYIAMMDWVKKQPDLDQPEILRQLTAILKERHEKTGEKDWLEKANIIEEGIDQFEEETLDIKLAENLFITELEKVELDMEQVALFFITVRKAIIENILSNSKNKEELWDLAHKNRKTEKSSGLYDPANWSAIF